MSLPIEVIRGKEEGPVMFVSAALHGDEINGVEIVRRLLAKKALKSIKGALIAVPIVNVFGFNSKSRYLPDRRDLNRSFPGSENGSLAGQLAHTFITEIVQKCTHGIDLHCAAINRINLPQIRACLDDPETQRMANAFNMPVALHSELRDGSLRSAARELGIPTLLFEGGEALRFNEKTIKSISNRIAEIPFVSQSKTQQVQFFEENVKLVLYLEKKKASRFDGVLGILTNEDDGSIELTGDVDLNLINAFNRGENLGLNWRKLKGNSQDLKINFAYPFFLNTPFGIEANFKLFKRDTTFIDLISHFGINYAFQRGEYLSLFIENKSSSLLSKNRFLNQTNSNLPPFGDIRVNLFGVGYRLQRLNYKYNPTRGINLQTSFAVGRKKLQKIAALEEEQPEIYEGTELNTTQYNGDLNVQFFIPLAARSTVLIGNQSATTYSQNLYQNELLRIGGLKILRGFDEESINVSTYSIFTLEYRFLLDRNSFFSVFSDGGYYESNSVGNYISDTPYGIGAGISFETNAGIFTFNYAIGKQFDNPLDLRAAKIHFGFINFF
jgi:hypothetical protein